MIEVFVLEMVTCVGSDDIEALMANPMEWSRC